MASGGRASVHCGTWEQYVPVLVFAIDNELKPVVSNQKTESFFSKSVTHVVTTRPIPDKTVEEADRRTGSLKSGNNIFRAPAGKENAQNATQTKRPGSESPTKRSTLDDARQDSLAGPNRRPRTRLGAAAAAANNSMLALRTPPKIKP